MLTPRRKSDTYHHGDLKSSAVAAGLRMVQINGVNNLGIRKVAEKLSVTPAALYRHFENIEELKIEISAEISLQLAEVMTYKRKRVKKLSNRKSFALARLYAIGEAYLDFARKESKLFELAFYCMAYPNLLKSNNSADQSWNILNESINELVEVGLLKKSKQEDFGHFAWSAVHGLATLVAQGFIKDSEYIKFKRGVLEGIGSSVTSSYKI